MAELKRDEYPRSNGYDADWVLAGDMGPHPLWLLEDLARDLELRPGMRVLDLGSGKGTTSVFLALEYGVQVWAADLWIGQIGVATPALRKEIRELGRIPDHIKKLVGWEALAWHTADWWRFQWEITELVEVTAARLQESGWADWLAWSRAVSEQRGTRDGALDMLEADQGEYLTFALIAARTEPACRS